MCTSRKKTENYEQKTKTHSKEESSLTKDRKLLTEDVTHTKEDILHTEDGKLPTEDENSSERSQFTHRGRKITQKLENYRPHKKVRTKSGKLNKKMESMQISWKFEYICLQTI